jgi:polyhydroxybutyrate depolymerase
MALLVVAACGGGGAGSSGGASTPVTAPTSTSSGGCGAAAKFSTGLQSLTSDGARREFWVDVPTDYDRSRSYPIVIALHWLGGNAGEVYNGNSWASAKPYYGLKELYGSGAIFVAPQGLDAGWANPGGRDLRFLRAAIEQLQQGMCVDKQRVFATGFSFGGMMSNAIGCQMGDVVRAIAPMSGSLWSGCGESSHRVAAVFFHAREDNVVPYTAGEEARSTFTSRNACTASTQPVGSNGCVEYQGCASGKPVVWCGYANGGHWPTSFSARETKAFFDRF